MSKKFINPYLSYSRLNHFEQCPLSFRLHYIEKRQSTPGLALRFGSMIHTVLERLVREVIDNEQVGKLSESRALELYQETWTAEGLVGSDLYSEGAEIIESFIRDQGIVDHRDILAVEEEFEIKAGRFPIRGFIDRVDCVDNETIEIIDYKTNRLLFTREEVDTSLQLSLYQIAAQQIWPWAKKVKLTYHMLRHGFRMVTERTQDQLDRALEYVQTLGQMTEEATEFPARLNNNCIYCDHRDQCPAYADALKGKREMVCKDLDDLDQVAREREEVFRLSKVLNARKRELEGVLKAHLKEKDELVLNGVRYRMFNTAKVEYPLDRTLELLENVSGISRDQLLNQIVNIDNKALERLLKELGTQLDKPRVTLLKAELKTVAEKSYSPRFWAKEVSS
ncbi:MAG: PD-(D/E)XK nuclease family protein [Proteobacteria bacterium]|nr:PD-(D/E)XK nuclease family protein [Pseudomonadota bacterium]